MKLKNTIIASSIMIITSILLSYINHAEDIKPNKPLATFPVRIGEWDGKEDRFESRIYDVLGVSDSFLGHYRTPDGRYIQLYIGFYQSQREGAQIHSPRNCMPGGGWNIIDTSLEDIKIAGSNPGQVKVIKLELQNGGAKQVALYWYQSRGRIISSEYWQKIYRVIDSIVRHRTDGSFIRLLSPVIDENQDEALKSLKDFAEQILPILNEYIPS